MLTALVLASVTGPKLAIVARFYYPFPDKRTSYSRLYTVGWDGRNRRVLSLPGQECESVAWAGRNRLVYSVRYPGDTYETSLWTVRLDGGNPRLLAKNGSIDDDKGFRESRDGVPVVAIGKKLLTVGPNSGRLIPVALQKNAWYDPFDGKHGGFRPATVKSNDSRHPGSFSVDKDYIAVLSTPKGQVKNDDVTLYGYLEPESNRFWVFDHPSMHSMCLHRVRWDTGKIQKLFWAGYELDWRPDRPFVAFTTQRDTSPYGPKKQVWTNEVCVGILETGAQRTLKLPMAWFDDVAVRPGPG